MTISGGLCKIYEGAREVTTSFVLWAKPILRSPDDADTALRFIADASVLVRAVAMRSYDAAKPILVSIGAGRSIISVAKFVWDLDKLTSGKIAEEYRQGKILSVVASVTILAARTIMTASWAVTVGIIQVGSVAKHVQKIDMRGYLARFATHPVATALARAPHVDMLFLVGLSALAANNAIALHRGEQKEKNTLELVSLGADITLGLLGLVVRVHPVVNALLGVVATGCSIASLSYNSQNSPS